MPHERGQSRPLVAAGGNGERCFDRFDRNGQPFPKEGQPVAAMAWASSTPKVTPRDRFVGWTPEQCVRNIHLIAYNTRYLILPFVRVPGLASQLLSALARRISRDWQQWYGHPLYLLETFVDPERFAGTAYRAANWLDLGLTTGRGKNDPTNQRNRSRKRHWVYPLQADWRQKLVAEVGSGLHELRAGIGPHNSHDKGHFLSHHALPAG